MKFAIAFLAVLTVGCSGMKAYKNPALKNNPQWQPFDADAGNLATADNEGRSKTDFTVPLNTGFDHKILSISFHTKSGHFSQAIVQPPAVTADGCKEQPQVRLVQGKSGALEVPVYWNKGLKTTVKSTQVKAGTGVFALEPNTDYVLTIVLNVDRACTSVKGTLNVQLK